MSEEGDEEGSELLFREGDEGGSELLFREGDESEFSSFTARDNRPAKISSLVFMLQRYNIFLRYANIFATIAQKMLREAGELAMEAGELAMEADVEEDGGDGEGDDEGYPHTFGAETQGEGEHET